MEKRAVCVHADAKTVKNTENTDGQKNEIQRKIRQIIIVGLRLVLSKTVF
jgi:hypothetical protein